MPQSDKSIFLKDCPDCKGSGTVRQITKTIFEECEECLGKGKVLNNAIEPVQEIIPKKEHDDV